MSNGPPLKQVIGAYMALRAERDAIKAKADSQVAEKNAKLDRLEAYILAKMNEEGVDSYKTDYGTAIKTTSDYVTVADWDEVLDFVKQHAAYHLLEKRVNKVAVRDYIDAGRPPPGVSYNTRTNVTVRRPATKA